MSTIRIQGIQGSMGAHVLDVPVFPDSVFTLGFPEAIGPAHAAQWYGTIAPAWEEQDGGVWESHGQAEGILSYTQTFEPYEDYVDVRSSLTNEGDEPWDQTLAFNCFNAAGCPPVRDHECIRHYVGLDGVPRKLTELPRVFGPRPTIQLYSVEGAPRGQEIPFVANFGSTPDDLTLEGWMAIVSRDGEALVAAVSKPALFLFQNMEYSCIHSAAGFGSLEPGETGTSLTRLYFVRQSIDEWYARMTEELA